MTDQPIPNPMRSCADILNLLDKGTIDPEYSILRWSSNYAFLINLVNEGDQVTAVYKPQRGERPLWDFPDGTLCYRERAAFLTSEELGWEIVPPTVLRDGPRGIGSMQYFIDHDPQVNYFTLDGSFAPQLQRIAAFDYLVNNADRKGGHCLLDATGHVWGIDHGITFNVVHKLRTVIWDYAGQPLADDLMTAVNHLCDTLDQPNSAYACAMVELLSEQEIASFRRRLTRMTKTRRYPMPGPGPNYPWPPV
ncbi:MAG: SCO1664 family protein [Chloroflexota bacterium]|nr:SCO1664 family protein [Chloroflexota bacterium]